MNRRQLAGSAIAVAILLASSLSGLAPASATRAATDAQTLFVANNYNPTSFDPGISYDQVGPAVFRNVYEPLVRLKGSGSAAFEGVLATSWTTSADKKTWTFKLRKGVTFHDGTPVNADAVKFSILRTFSLNLGPNVILGTFMDAAGITVLDPYTIQFHCKVPAPRLLATMSSQWGNWVLSPTAIKKHAVKHDMGQAWLANHDAGSGPYMLSQYVPNSSVTLVKYSNYWRGWSGHHVSKVVMSFVTQEQTRRSLIEKGDVDLTLTFSPQNLRAMESNPQLKVDLSPGVLQELMVPTVYGPFASAQARQALAYAFDYNAMNNIFLKGFAEQAQGPIAHHIFGHDFALPMYKSDLAKAKALFTQAGVKPGTTITCWYIKDDLLARQIALITQAQLGQLGLNVKLTGYDTAAYQNAQAAPLSALPLAKRPNLWVSNWFPDYSDPIDVITPVYRTRSSIYGGVNAGLYSDKQVDALLDQAAVTTDPIKQQALFNKIQYILDITDPVAVFISDTSYEQVYRASLHGFYSNPSYGNTFDFYPLWK